MNSPLERRKHGYSRFTNLQPLDYSKKLARNFNCDLAVPNGPGLGNILLYTRLVVDMGWKQGKPLTLLSCPMNLKVGKRIKESAYPVWENNPFIDNIIDPSKVEPTAEANLVYDKDDLCQFSHITENLCNAYGITASRNHGAIYLTQQEMSSALNTLSHLPRPIVCFHPAGKSSSSPHSPWFRDNWHYLYKKFSGKCSIFQVSLPAFDQKNIEIEIFDTTVRQMMSLIWACDIFVGFDSGPGHVATAFNKPSIILWDIMEKRRVEGNKEPGFETAMLARWSYPQNDNILIYGERNNDTLYIVEQHLKQKLKLLNCKGTHCSLNFQP